MATFNKYLKHNEFIMFNINNVSYDATYLKIVLIVYFVYYFVAFFSDSFFI